MKHEDMTTNELIAALKQCEEERDAARKDAEYYRAILDGADDIIQVISPDGIMQFMSKSVEKHAGLKVEDMIGKRVEYPPEEMTKHREVFRPVYEGSVGSTAVFTHRVVAGPGVHRVLESTMVNQFVPPVNGVVAVSRDITERADIAKSWDNIDAHTRSIFNGVNDAILVHDANGLITQTNRKAVDMLVIETSMPGTSVLADELYGPMSTDFDLRDLWVSVLHGESGEYQWRMRRRTDGKEFEIQVYLSAIDIDGKPHILAAIRDITELKNSIAEKEALLREVHHRVKNNFAVMTSLLRMQQRRVKDDSLNQLIKETEFRVRCMGFVHEKLHQSESLSALKIDKYLESLVMNLKYSYNSQDRQIKVDAEIEDVELGPDSAIPLGFITSELVSNAFKHAFPEKRPGNIMVRLESRSDDELELSVKDDGVGIPANLEIDKLESLGLTLVTTFVSQLKGSWELQNGEGACWKIRFPKPERKTRPA